MTCKRRDISGNILKFGAVSRHFLHRNRLAIKRNCSREEWKEGKRRARAWWSEQIQCITRSLTLQRYSWGDRENIAELSVGCWSTALCYSCHDLLRWSELKGAGGAGWWAKQGGCALNTSWGIKELPLRNSLFNRNFECISFRGCSAQLPLLPFSSAYSRTPLTLLTVGITKNPKNDSCTYKVTVSLLSICTLDCICPSAVKIFLSPQSCTFSRGIEACPHDKQCPSFSLWKLLTLQN